MEIKVILEFFPIIFRLIAYKIKLKGIFDARPRRDQKSEQYWMQLAK